MTVNIREADREQLFLMPPSVRDWLPEGHLAWFVLDVVGELDLAAFYDSHREDGRGGASYDPALMLAVLVYAYCSGERSSRRIEKHLQEDVAYRVLCANQAPDHATIARFRRRHEDAIAEVFTQVLGLCVTAGIVDLGLVAIDGTKIAANASNRANRSRSELVKEILAEAEETDQKEDRLFGERRGDELPEEWSDRRDRRARIKEALRQLDVGEGDYEARLAARKARARASGWRYPRGRHPEPNSRRTKKRLSNTTDPESRTMSVPGWGSRRYFQAFNAQAAATIDQVVVAAEVTQDANDFRQFIPLVNKVEKNLAKTRHASPVGTYVADAGYYSTANATVPTDSEVLIATLAPTSGVIDPNDPEMAGRQAVIERLDRGELTKEEAAELLSLSPRRVAELLAIHRGEAVDHNAVRTAMDEKLATEDGAQKFAKRKQIVEPVFGNVKANRGYRRFSRRGLRAVQSEWRLICATHNLLKLRNLAPMLNWSAG
ncbi:MAG: transposase [Acidimicrobiales bacterium]